MSMVVVVIEMLLCKLSLHLSWVSVCTMFNNSELLSAFPSGFFFFFLILSFLKLSPSLPLCLSIRWDSWCYWSIVSSYRFRASPSADKQFGRYSVSKAKSILWFNEYGICTRVKQFQDQSEWQRWRRWRRRRWQ